MQEAVSYLKELLSCTSLLDSFIFTSHVHVYLYFITKIVENQYILKNHIERNDSMEEITKLFNNPNFGVLEVVLINGKEHFPAIDCAEMLGYVNPRDAIAKHCKTPGVAIRDVGVETGTKADGTPAIQIVHKKYITEGNLYRLITHSKLPAAEKFESWVFDEVIPDIRRTGMYGISSPAGSDAGAMNSETIAKIVTMAVTETIKQLMPLIRTRQEPYLSEFREDDIGTLDRKIGIEDVIYSSGKIEGFPKEFRNEVNKILLEMKEKQNVNYSAVARYCTANGHRVSFMSVKRYYCKHFK